MRTTEAIALFGSITELAAALKITRQAVHQWGERVPKLREYQIREMVHARELTTPQQDAIA